jgi:2-polyprenyl-3-methyl-5-hydroxy-6-metoxy-1,4-benzoquinol methylase
VNDPRRTIYSDLHGKQLKGEEQANRHSATRILDILWTYFQPTSVLDVGCGIGTWLSVLEDRGLKNLVGIEGAWLNPTDLVCNSAILEVIDLEAGFDLGRRFELVICLEVAEHLSPKASTRFVQSLCHHTSAVLFSAAIPFQGGQHHVNEQFLSYWEPLFAKHEFRLLDVIRGQIWQEKQVLWWLRQNTVLFAHKEMINANDSLRLAAHHQRAPISIVHPDVYVSRIRTLLAQVEEHKKLDAFLREGGSFKSQITPEGQLQLIRLRS